MKIVYEPLRLKSNKYSEIVSKSLAEEGITCLSLKQVLTNWSHIRSVEIFHLNWYENLNGDSTYTLWKDYFKRLFLILLLKLFSKKIVWTMHNRRPHERRLLFLKKSLLAQLVKKSEVIVTHSKVSAQILADEYNESVQEKITYIPHPNYVGLYGPSLPKRIPNGTDEPLRLIFIGAIKPYKNIELLIEAVKSLQDENVHLDIHGAIHQDGYEEKLRSLCKGNSNIQLHSNFVADDQIQEYLSKNDLLVCPYNMESSLNSGSVILAFSYRATVICPNIGTVSDFNGNPNILSYEYEDHVSHLEALTAAIKKAVHLKKEDPEVFHKMGEHMYQQVLALNSRELVTARLGDLYKSIV